MGMKNAVITGLGAYLPRKVTTNHDLCQVMNTTDAWIQERTGIKERRYADVENGEQNFMMAAHAAREALAHAALGPADIDMIVYATLSSDYVFPGSGVLLQRELGCRQIPALDIRAQCSGFVYGLSIAQQFIRTGMCRNVLLVGSEIHSTGLDFSDSGRHISVIFGDGAGAAVISASDDSDRGILSTHLHSDGTHAEELALIDPAFSKKERFHPDMLLPGGSFYPVMNGQLVFKNAVVRFEEVIMEALAANGLATTDISLLVPHQANLRISQMIQKKLGLPDEKVKNVIEKYGNTTAASIPIGLYEAWKEGSVKKGDLVCLAAFGSGFTWASALIRW